MPIDATKPVDNVDASKADLRANLLAAKDGILTADSANPGTAIIVSSTNFGDHTFVRIRCTANSAVTVTLANSAPAGVALELVQYGTGIITAVSGSGATLLKPPTTTAVTTSQYDAMIFEVDTNSGTNAVWRMVART